MPENYEICGRIPIHIPVFNSYRIFFFTKLGYNIFLQYRVIETNWPFKTYYAYVYSIVLYNA